MDRLGSILPRLVPGVIDAQNVDAQSVDAQNVRLNLAGCRVS